jgi:hypothetical protein
MEMEIEEYEYHSYEKEDSEDEESKEIDYPDSEHSEKTDEDESFFDYNENEEEKDNIDKNWILTTCSVCFNQYKFNSCCKLEHLDRNHFISLNLNELCFLYPCERHYICYSCIRKSLLTNTFSTLKMGEGHFPCLGSVNCKNKLGQQTTIYLPQLKFLFTLTEWLSICQMNDRTRIVNHDKVHHPYLSPLKPLLNVTYMDILNHLINLLNNDYARVQCPICETWIQKTTDCFSLRHCDWEICWMCHKIDRRLDNSHWVTCPRYDYDLFFQRLGYECKEGQCFDELHICENPRHIRGIQIMSEIRKSYQIYHLVFSISGVDQIKLVDELKRLNLFDLVQYYIGMYCAHIYK